MIDDVAIEEEHNYNTTIMEYVDDERNDGVENVDVSGEKNMENEGENDENEEVGKFVNTTNESEKKIDEIEQSEEEIDISSGYGDFICSDSAQGSRVSHKKSQIDGPSSMVRRVRTQTSRMKKLKNENFVTPPTSEPFQQRQKRKKYAKVNFVQINDSKEAREIDIEGESLTIYKGRSDFCGQTEVSTEDVRIIELYLSRNDLK